MAQAYTPGLLVSEKMTILKERRLPLKGEVLVKVGDKVTADTVIARTFLPGMVEFINVANKLGVEPRDVKPAMIKQAGDKITKDEIIAKSSGLFGMFKSNCTSTTNGTIESISDVTGQVTIRHAPTPVEIEAYIDGIVKEIIPEEGVVIESYGTFIQGIFGVGGETKGEIVVIADSPNEPLISNKLTSAMKGKIVLGGSYIPFDVIEKGISLGIKGIIAGGIDDADLKKFLGYDLGVAITGNENKGITVVVTEGFGQIAMAEKTFRLLKSREGSRASINGATQIRAGVIRPEIVIPLLDLSRDAATSGNNGLAAGLASGVPVRIIREPHFGAIAKVVSLPVEPSPLATEAKVRVVEVELNATGERFTLPRANIELIEDIPAAI